MSLKQRLIGATVLIALAVIFVPMFLDGAGHRERTAVNIDIPPEPEFEFEKRLPPMPEIGNESYEFIEPQESVSSAEELPDLPPSIVKMPEDSKSRTVPAREVPTVPPIANRPAARAETKPKPPARTVEEGWVVQVGSFKQKRNADVLRDRLKAAGYQVIEEKGGTRNIPIYRIKVGPVEKRERASGLLAKLRKEQKLDGYVAQFP